jgi:DNA repair exonuclease SbcCD ATPase subunit
MWDRTSAFKAEIQGLRNELEAAKTHIEKLEGSIAENYNFKILAEQNEALKSELQSYKNQNLSLQNTIATMKIESDILDNYKTKVLQDQNEHYARRIQQLEREQRMVAPLVNEMVATLQRHGLTSSLQSDIDQYRAQVMRSQAAANNTSSVSAAAAGSSSSGQHDSSSYNNNNNLGQTPKHASAMGRSQISPIPNSH